MDKQELSIITVPKDEAAEKWKEYIALEKRNKSKELHEFRQIYYQLSQGKAVLDLFETMKKVGLNSEGEPRIAVTTADAKDCTFRKIEETQGRFQNSDSYWRYSLPESITLPKGTFPRWPKTDRGSIIREMIKAPRPGIPPEVMAKLDGAKLGHPYYILWEVEHWQAIPPKDPILLRRITNNIFVIVAK